MAEPKYIDAAVQLAKKASSTSLPIDSASHGNRSKEMGFSVDAYHGSPRDIKKFTNKYSSPDGHYGPHHYFTSNKDDASHNYAGEGLDATTQAMRLFLDRNVISVTALVKAQEQESQKSPFGTPLINVYGA